MLQHATLIGFCLVSSLGPFLKNNFPSLFLSFSVLLIRLFIYLFLVVFICFFLSYVLFCIFLIHPFFSFLLICYVFLIQITFSIPLFFHLQIKQHEGKLKYFLSSHFSTPSIKWTTTLVLSFCLHLSQIRIVTKIVAQK